MEDTIVIMTIEDLTNYVEECEKQAQAEIVRDHIKPYDASKARKVMAQIHNDEPKRRHTSPRELTVRVIRGNEADFENIQQFLVREK